MPAPAGSNWGKRRLLLLHCCSVSTMCIGMRSGGELELQLALGSGILPEGWQEWLHVLASAISALALDSS